MLTFSLVVINSTILLSLGLLHFYWAFGGQWGFEDALPTNKEGERILNPKMIDSVIVGFGLLIFGIYLLIYGGILSLYLPEWVFDYGIWFVSAIFLVRAIGDFRYVGFFKKIKETDFAARDLKYYSPLCLWLSLSNMYLVMA